MQEIKIRQAKKILNYNPNSKLNEHSFKRCMELRPPYKHIVNGEERTIYPSWHDIDIIARARTRLRRWIKNKKK